MQKLKQFLLGENEGAVAGGGEVAGNTTASGALNPEVTRESFGQSSFASRSPQFKRKKRQQLSKAIKDRKGR